MVHESVNLCDPDIRKELMSGVMASGGSTLYAGFCERLTTELSEVTPQVRILRFRRVMRILTNGAEGEVDCIEQHLRKTVRRLDWWLYPWVSGLVPPDLDVEGRVRRARKESRQSQVSVEGTVPSSLI